MINRTYILLVEARYAVIAACSVVRALRLARRRQRVEVINARDGSVICSGTLRGIHNTVQVLVTTDDGRGRTTTMSAVRVAASKGERRDR